MSFMARTSISPNLSLITEVVMKTLHKLVLLVAAVLVLGAFTIMEVNNAVEAEAAITTMEVTVTPSVAQVVLFTAPIGRLIRHKGRTPAQQIMCVPEAALAAHLAHGDRAGNSCSLPRPPR